MKHLRFRNDKNNSATLKHLCPSWSTSRQALKSNSKFSFPHYPSSSPSGLQTKPFSFFLQVQPPCFPHLNKSLNFDLLSIYSSHPFEGYCRIRFSGSYRRLDYIPRDASNCTSWRCIKDNSCGAVGDGETVRSEQLSTQKGPTKSSRWGETDYLWERRKLGILTNFESALHAWQNVYPCSLRNQISPAIAEGKEQLKVKNSIIHFLVWEIWYDSWQEK